MDFAGSVDYEYDWNLNQPSCMSDFFMSIYDWYVEDFGNSQETVSRSHRSAHLEATSLGFLASLQVIE